MLKNFKELLNKYQNFLEEIKTGYNFSIYDYINDLSIRDLPEKELEYLPKEIKNNYIHKLYELDTVFKNLTNEIKKPVGLPEVKPASPQQQMTRWWYYRIPKNLGPELKRDLKGTGLIS